ncbi:MAG TPA: META domain-containing protein [Gemmatimonadaceae bacterium]|nr:META domain-containing protein [Gemmatimonadaceae bacterium]
MRRSFLPAVLLLLAACHHSAGSGTMTDAEFRALVAGREWEMVLLAGGIPPTGSGGRRATIKFDSTVARAEGFAGCNRFGTAYETDGRAIRFAAVTTTRMACSDGMDLERQMTDVLERTRRLELIDDRLTLFDDHVALARFAPVAPPRRDPR